MNSKKLHTIGRVELVDLPEWGINSIEAKVDTGAFSSSIHCHNIEEIKVGTMTMVRFNLLDPDHSDYNERQFELPLYDKREVKSSNGISETRLFILAKIELFKEVHDIELSLTDRSLMKYPILLGRKFVRNKFLVDVSKKNYSHKSEQ